MPYFDRFDVCEAWWCLAHDHGLYGIITRLERMKFKPRPNLRTDDLNDNANAIYNYWDSVLETWGSRRCDPYDEHHFRGMPLAT